MKVGSDNTSSLCLASLTHTVLPETGSKGLADWGPGGRQEKEPLGARMGRQRWGWGQPAISIPQLWPVAEVEEAAVWS